MTTIRQDYIDAMNRYYELHQQYGAVFEKMGQPGGLSLSPAGLESIGALGDRLEEARKAYEEKARLWVQSGCP